MKKIIRFSKNILNSLCLCRNLAPLNIHIDEAVNWILRAQDASPDGGVSAGYHLYHGWLSSYPETTGYIIETLFDYYKNFGGDPIFEKAISMADWLCSIQNSDGSIPDPSFKKSMVFDTGQVLFGYIRTYKETKNEKYLRCARSAGNWLVNVQENDGVWKNYAAHNIPHTYYSRVAWSLLELFCITDNRIYLEKGIKNIEWCLKQQNENGWFNNAGFRSESHPNPFTHTIAYTIRGILEAASILENEQYWKSVQLSIDNFLPQVKDNGFVSGTFDENWNGDHRFSCLTGNAQLAIILFKLFKKTNNITYQQSALKINHYLKTRQNLKTNNPNIRGAIAGSFPIWGKYIHFNYPNWAAKFFIDSLLKENQLGSENNS
jgi:hypothetical protein